MKRRYRPMPRSRNNAPMSGLRSHFPHSLRPPASRRNQWYFAWCAIECQVFELHFEHRHLLVRWTALWRKERKKKHSQSVSPDITRHTQHLITENNHTKHTVWCDARKYFCRHRVWCTHRIALSSLAFSIAPQVCDGSCKISPHEHHSSCTRPFLLRCKYFNLVDRNGFGNFESTVVTITLNVIVNSKLQIIIRALWFDRQTNSIHLFMFPFYPSLYRVYVFRQEVELFRSKNVSLTQIMSSSDDAKTKSEWKQDDAVRFNVRTRDNHKSTERKPKRNPLFHSNQSQWLSSKIISW